MTIAGRSVAVAALASAAAAALIGAGCGPAKQDAQPPSMTEARLQHAEPLVLANAQASLPVEFVAGGENLWLRTLRPPYLWRIDARDLSATPIETSTPIDEVAAGADELWATTFDPETQRNGIVRLSPSTNTTVATKTLPAACDPVGGVVFNDEFWVYCGDSLLAYNAENDGPVRRLDDLSPSPLIVGTNGLWRVTKSEIAAVAGAAMGTRWPIEHQDAVRWSVTNNIAWALTEASSGSVLVRLDLTTGEERAYPIATGTAFPLDVEPARAEVWVTTDKSTLRFRPEESQEPVAEVALGQEDAHEPSTVHLTADEDAMWAVVQRGPTINMYKLPLSR